MTPPEQESAQPPAAPEQEPGPAGLKQRLQARATRRGEQLVGQLEELRRRNQLVDLAHALVERDREAHGSVLGSAAALRLFLFMVPATAVAVSLVSLIHLQRLLREMEQSLSTGEVARTMSDVGGWQAVWILLTGLVLTAVAGRALTRVLAATAVAAWQLPAKQAKAVPLAIGLLSLLFLASPLTRSVLAHIEQISFIPGSALLWVTVAALSGTAWFLILAVLPRGVRDPGALLPAAITMGIAYAGLQAFAHLYLPSKIARNADTFGDLAVTVAVLGNYFLIGRLMALTLVLNAVVYERIGSVSQIVFALPLVRALPRRYPAVARYFNLEPAAA